VELFNRAIGLLEGLPQEDTRVGSHLADLLEKKALWTGLTPEEASRCLERVCALREKSVANDGPLPGTIANLGRAYTNFAAVSQNRDRRIAFLRKAESLCQSVDVQDSKNRSVLYQLITIKIGFQINRLISSPRLPLIFVARRWYWPSDS